VAITDGKEHPVDSKPVAFEIAGREAFKLACERCCTSDARADHECANHRSRDHMGDVLGDLNTRRARVQGMDTHKGHSVVTAQVPLAEMLRYTTDLRSFTGGRGIFTMEFSNYETVPAHLAQELIAARQKNWLQPRKNNPPRLKMNMRKPSLSRLPHVLLSMKSSVVSYKHCTVMPASTRTLLLPAWLSQFEADEDHRSQTGHPKACYSITQVA